jgi:hypothetical protein
LAVRGFPRTFSAVAQALSRRTRDGTRERLSKGVYYRSRETAFEKSGPNPAAILQLTSRRKTVFPSGIAAANLMVSQHKQRNGARLPPAFSAYRGSSLGRTPLFMPEDPRLEVWERGVALTSKLHCCGSDLLAREENLAALAPSIESWWPGPNEWCRRNRHNSG